MIVPEQSKYTTALEMIPDDPNTITETYVFLPSLRRSLRLSSSPRCAPFLGTDYVGDDTFGFVPLPVGWFNAKFRGHQKLLLFRPTPGNRAQFDKKNFYSSFWFPKPVVGKWQVFDALVVDIRRVPSLRSGYCYGLRRIYVDPRTWNVQYVDLFDSSMKFWKMAAAFESAEPVPGGGYVINQRGVNSMIDFQNLHVTVSVNGKDAFAVNQDVPKQYQDGPGNLTRAQNWHQCTELAPIQRLLSTHILGSMCSASSHWGSPIALRAAARPRASTLLQR